MWVQLYLSPASAALPGTHYSWVGRSNVSNVSCSRKHNHWFTSYSPINTAGPTGAMRVKFLAQGKNSKQQCLGIEPVSVGSQADPKPLKP